MKIFLNALKYVCFNPRKYIYTCHIWRKTVFFVYNMWTHHIWIKILLYNVLIYIYIYILKYTICKKWNVNIKSKSSFLAPEIDCKFYNMKGETKYISNFKNVFHSASLLRTYRPI